MTSHSKIAQFNCPYNDWGVAQAVLFTLFYTSHAGWTKYNEHQCLNKATGCRLAFLIGKYLFNDNIITY